MRIRNLSDEIRALERHLSVLVKRVAPRTLSSSASGQCTPLRCLSRPGENIERLSSETAFAHLCGRRPDPRVIRQDRAPPPQPRRQPRRQPSLYMIGVVRLRYCARTRDYSARRTAEGKSKQEIIRCLKRYIAREVYHALRADLKDLASAT
jgi:transposase